MLDTVGAIQWASEADVHMVFVSEPRPKSAQKASILPLLLAHRLFYERADEDARYIRIIGRESKEFKMSCAEAVIELPPHLIDH